MSKKLIETQSRFYVNAKRASQEYEGVTRGLIRGAVSIPPQGTIQEIQQVCASCTWTNLCWVLICVLLTALAGNMETVPCMGEAKPSSKWRQSCCCQERYMSYCANCSTDPLALVCSHVRLQPMFAVFWFFTRHLVWGMLLPAES